MPLLSSCSSNFTASVLFFPGGESCGIPALDPRQLCADMAALGLPTAAWWGKANKFILPRGKEYGRGWLLLMKEDITDEVLSSSEHKIMFTNSGVGYTAEEQTTILLEKLTIVSCRSVYNGGNAEAPESIYLVEFADLRYYGKMSTVISAYNVPSNQSWLFGSNEFTELTNEIADTDIGPTTPGEMEGEILYLPNTMRTPEGERGTLAEQVDEEPYTWYQILEDLWSNLPPIFGEVPSLESDYFTLPGPPRPENLVFWGVSAWEAINKLIDDAQMMLVLRPDGSFVLRQGSDLDQHNDPFLEYLATQTSLEFTDLARSNLGAFIPETYVVSFPNYRNFYFAARNRVIACAEDYWRAQPQDFIEVSSVAIDAELEGKVVVGTKKVLHVPEPVRTIRGTNIAVDGADDEFMVQLAEFYVAQEIASVKQQKQDKHAVFIGAKNLLPDVNFAAVVWSDTGNGIRTEIYRALSEPMLAGKPIDQQVAEAGNEFPGVPDLSRTQTPYHREALIELAEELLPNFHALGYLRITGYAHIDGTIGGDTAGGTVPGTGKVFGDPVEGVLRSLYATGINGEEFPWGLTVPEDFATFSYRIRANEQTYHGNSSGVSDFPGEGGSSSAFGEADYEYLPPVRVINPFWCYYDRSTFVNCRYDRAAEAWVVTHPSHELQLAILELIGEPEDPDNPILIGVAATRCTLVWLRDNNNFADLPAFGEGNTYAYPRLASPIVPLEDPLGFIREDRMIPSGVLAWIKLDEREHRWKLVQLACEADRSLPSSSSGSSEGA